MFIRWATWRRATWSRPPSTPGYGETGDPCVYLDARGIDDFARRFPTVTAACRAAGIDPTRQPIPVVPGAHYSCGGVVTDVYGRTELPGLFAAGEVARTGMHGANRLASNSLLEGLVVGGRAGKAAAQHAVEAGPARAELGEVGTRVALPRKKLQRAMSRYASVVRDGDGLQRLTQELEAADPRDLDCRTSFEDVALTTTARASRQPLRHVPSRAAVTTAPTSRRPTRRWRTARCSPRPVADGTQQ